MVVRIPLDPGWQLADGKGTIYTSLLTLYTPSTGKLTYLFPAEIKESYVQKNNVMSASLSVMNQLASLLYKKK